MLYKLICYGTDKSISCRCLYAIKCYQKNVKRPLNENRAAHRKQVINPCGAILCAPKPFNGFLPELINVSAYVLRISTLSI